MQYTDAVLSVTRFTGSNYLFYSYEGFGSTRLAALACYALAGRRCAAPPPRYGYVARFTGFECRSLALAN